MLRPDIERLSGRAYANVSHTAELSSRGLAHTVAAFAACVVLALGSFGLLRLSHSQGASPTGDEPHYLVAALALGRFHTLQVGAAYRYAAAHSTFTTWTHPPVEQAVPSHGGLYAYHEPGLAILLALPVAAAGLHGAYAALVLLAVLLTVWLCYLIGSLSTERSPWRLAIAAVFLAPAYLLASSQFYPDLISGLLIAIVVALIAKMEARRSSTWAQLVCCGLFIGYLPWLHIQNVVFGAVLVLGLAAVTWWRRLRFVPLVAALAIAFAMWGLMAIYNNYVFARPQGPAGQNFTWGALSWTRILGLLIDKQQGIFVQFPVIVLGVAALWLIWRRLPIAVLTAGLVSVAVWIVSGASANSFGGESFVGRFNWTSCPVLLAFAGLYLLEALRKRPGLALGLAGAVAVVYGLQLVSVVSGNHTYYSTAWLTPPPPPGSGWWGPFDRVLPSFDQLVLAWSSTRVLWATLFVVLLAGLLVYASISLMSRATRLTAVVTALLLAGSASMLGETAASARQLAAPVTIPASLLSSGVGRVIGTSRTVTGDAQHGALVYGPYWTLPDGSYEATVSYSLDDQTPGAAESDVHLTGFPPSKSQLVLARAYLVPSSVGRAVLRFSIRHKALFEVRTFWFGSGTLTVNSVRVAQLSSG